MNKGYDPKVPLALKETQDWFASIITMPIDNDSRMTPFSPKGVPMAEEAKKYILPSQTLEPASRIQIYNQQYWWRLLGTLHDNFPLMTRLFGYRQFNDMIGTPYLMTYPPDHWSLNHLGSKLPLWVREKYEGDDKLLVAEAADIDWAYNETFFAAEHPFFDIHQTAKDNNEAILKEKLFLQPHLHLFTLKHTLFPFRTAMLEQEPEYWEEHDFPELNKDKTYHFVLYRDLHTQICWVELDPFEFKLLECFKKGITIEQGCQWLEKQDQAFLQAAAENLHLWFQEWTIRRWLCVLPKNGNNP